LPPALAPGCTVLESVPGPSGMRTETALPACGGGASPCFTVQAEASCTDSSASIAVTRTADVPPGAALVVRCQ